ncbi:large ribosomal subunit protein uL4m [Culicoides brevitarsis]|uniref:large ribosomal subunit protein uL4m n=1 Tax=Culicoides brevitarsis TaxID=469753 RepID=UPI00307C2CAC
MLNLVRQFSRALVISSRECSSLAGSRGQNTLHAENQALMAKVAASTCLRAPRQIWVENIDTPEQKNLELIEVHPDVYATMPRVDLIHENITWQRKYRYVSFAHTKTRNEVRGGGRKPFPQKGRGCARHGSIRSPLFKGGGVAHGPRSPTTHFYMLDWFSRVQGLTSTLSVKLAQDDLHVITDLDIPTDDPKYLVDLMEKRNWGPSCLFVDDLDIIPENIALAMEELGHVNFMPVYGLNVYSMIKHDTLVLTKSAAMKIQQKLLEALNRNDGINAMKKFALNQ